MKICLTSNLALAIALKFEDVKQRNIVYGTLINNSMRILNEKKAIEADLKINPFDDTVCYRICKDQSGEFCMAIGFKSDDMQELILLATHKKRM